MMLVVAGFLMATAAVAQVAGRVLDEADVAETPARYDLTIRFSCSIRYLAHAPTDKSAEVRVRLALGSDCGALNATESLISPATALVRSIELSPLLASDVELVIRWRREQQFLVVPTNDQRGLRIRVLRSGEVAGTGKVMVDEMPSTDVVTAYAINLDSSRSPFPESALQQARSTFGDKVYVSEFEVEGARWYRLRYGPIALRDEAERQLLKVQATYPRAWLAIADEVVDESALAPAADAAVSVAAPDTSESRINDAVADELWSSGNEQFRRKVYVRAIESFTKLVARPSGKYRVQAQELLGLAHERSGELAHAQAEYETFLRLYPRDRRASRVRKRLNALRTATLPGRSTGNAQDEEGTWTVAGGVAQYYRRDDNRITVMDTTQTQVGQQALLTDVDLTARYRGLDTDTRIRFSAGYNKSFINDGPGDQAYVRSAFVEWSDRDRGWYGSLGRQSRSGGGTYGTFDGLLASYQWQPHFTTDLTVGLPVESSRSGLSTQRLFESLALHFGTFADAWEPSLYMVNQRNDGYVDRQAVGAELRYFRAGRVVLGFVDYDLHFRVLNSAVLLGTFQLPSRWTLNVDAERRKSPLVTTRNALIGQPVNSLSALSSAFNDEEIRQLALARTPDVSIYGASVARPFGERLQLTLNAQSIKTSDSPPSDGSVIDPAFVSVEGIPGQGPELIVSAQLLAASIMRAGDVNIVGLRRQSGGAVNTTSLGLSSRVPIGGSWRIGPQLRVDQSRFVSDDSVLKLYAPSVRVSLQKPALLFELEAGAELSTRTMANEQQKTTRYFYYAGYRWQF